jgi:hypothetical protein
MSRVYRLVFLRDDNGMGAGEGAAYQLDTAARLVAGGLCRIDDSEPNKEELADAVKAYRPPAKTRYWEMPIVSRLGRELIAAFGLRNIGNG